jgi:hypothetical protein
MDVWVVGEPVDARGTEDFLNSVGPQVLAEVEAQRAAADRQDSPWRRLFRRRKG